MVDHLGVDHQVVDLRIQEVILQEVLHILFQDSLTHRIGILLLYTAISLYIMVLTVDTC